MRSGCRMVWSRTSPLMQKNFTGKKYKEIVYYFIKEHFHVYLPEHCGHGKSYRLVEDPSLVYVDSYHRYVEDLLFVARSFFSGFSGSKSISSSS